MTGIFDNGKQIGYMYTIVDNIT